MAGKPAAQVGDGEQYAVIWCASRSAVCEYQVAIDGDLDNTALVRLAINIIDNFYLLVLQRFCQPTAFQRAGFRQLKVMLIND